MLQMAIHKGGTRGTLTPSGFSLKEYNFRKNTLKSLFLNPPTGKFFSDSLDVTYHTFFLLKTGLYAQMQLNLYNINKEN